MRDKKICIYGRGKYGIETYLKLRDGGVHIDCFGDRNAKKCGYIIDGIRCITLDELMEKDREQWTIIVAIKNPEQIKQFFKREGFQKVDGYEEVFAQIESSLPERTKLNSWEKLCNMYRTLVEGYDCIEQNDAVSNYDEIRQMMKDYRMRRDCNEHFRS